MVKLLTPLFDQHRDWEASAVSNSEFAKKYHNLLRNVRIGTSFSPEQVEDHLKSQNAKVKSTNEKSKVALECLRVVVEEFKIHDIRLGIRWSTVDKEGGLDISYYKPFLKFCFEHNVNVTLNVGPIKTFRWPEQFVPEYVLQKIVVPQKRSIITADSPLANGGIEYVKKLFHELKKEFSEKELERIKIIQLENEPFHPFGIFGWRMGEDYMEKLIEITYEQFPQISFLINSSETRNVQKTAQFFQNLIAKNPALKNKLILGYNYFYNTPKPRFYSLIGDFDSISTTKFLRRNICSRNIDWSEKIGYKIEVTEGQTEPWPPVYSPGNSAHEFRFMILRSVKHLLNCQKQSLLRIWGIEQLVLAKVLGTITDEQKKIIELIQLINNKKLKI